MLDRFTSGLGVAILLLYRHVAKISRLGGVMIGILVVSRNKASYVSRGEPFFLLPPHPRLLLLLSPTSWIPPPS